MHVGGTTQRKRHHAGTDRGIRLPVDENERARRREIGERIHGDRRGGVEVAEAYFVQVQRTCRVVLQRIHVNFVLDAGNAHRHGGRAQTHQVRTASEQLLFGHPQHVRCELVCYFGPCFRGAQHIATRDVDFICQRQRDSIAGLCLGHVTISSDDTRHRGLLAGASHHDGLPCPHHATGDSAGIAAKVDVRAVHVLHRETERRCRAVASHVQFFQPTQ